MHLPEIWFGIVGILTAGYFVLEGFDYGIGILYPFLGHSDSERRASLGAIAPIWAANEVWLVAAGGALFAAFPNWYATMFSGFYLALILVLLGLIVRGVGLEYRSQDPNRRWRSTWDWLIFSGSLVVSLVWGMAFSNLVRGVPINRHMIYVGNFATLFNFFSIWGAITLVALVMYQGASYLAVKGDDKTRPVGRQVHRVMVWPAILMLGIWFLWMDRLPSSQGYLAHSVVITQLAAVLSLLAGRLADRGPKGLFAFWFTSLGIAATIFAMFRLLFPRVMVSSLNAAWNLTISNTASTPYTLDIMTITAIIILPIILGYQTWLHWTFRQPVNKNSLKY